MNAQELLKRYKIGERDFSRITLDFQSLIDVDLSGCNFESSTFCNSELQYTNFSNCNLMDCDFNSAELLGANLSGANLRNAKFYLCDLTSVDLSGIKTNLTNCTLISEILWRNCGFSITKQSICGLFRVHWNWSLETWLSDTAPNNNDQFEWQQIIVNNRKWIIDTLAQYVVEGDNALDVLKQLGGE